MEGDDQDNAEQIEFQVGFDAMLTELSTHRRVVEVLDEKIRVYFALNNHQAYEHIYRQFQCEHVKDLVDVLAQNESLNRLSFPVEILNLDSAAYLGRAVNRMAHLEELSLAERFFSSDPLAHSVLSQLDPAVSKLVRLRIEARLLQAPDIEHFLGKSRTLHMLRLNLCLGNPQDEFISWLGHAVGHSQSIKDLVINATTWERLATLLENIGENSRINRLDITFDTEVGETSAERQQAMLECMRLVASMTALNMLCISESSIFQFRNHLFYQKALANALTGNTSIRTLEMDGAIDQDGIDAFREALVVNTTLESLAIPSVRLGSFTAFAKRLGSMKGLKTIFFWGSKVLSIEETEAIEEGLSQNTTIWHMQFTYSAHNVRLGARIRYYLMANGMRAHELVATAPTSLMPHVLAVADRRSLSMLYTFLRQRHDIFYHR